MKKTVMAAAVIAVVLAAVLAGCGTQQEASASQGGRKTSRRVPAFIRQAMQKVEDDYLVGIGSSRAADTQQAMDLANANAYASISGQLVSVVSRLITDHRASSGADPNAVSSYQDTIVETLTHSKLMGARVVDGDFDDNGTYWAVARMPRDQSREEVRQAANKGLTQAKLRAAKAESAAALDRLHKAIADNTEKEVAAQAGEEIPVIGD